MNAITQQFTPTEEQQEVIAAVAGRDSVMVDALAGCTKSTTLQMAAPQVKVPALALAFNKKIATELAPRLPQNFATKTFNGLGHMAVARVLPGITTLKLDDRKIGKLVSQLAKDRKMELSSEQWDSLRRLVTEAMQAGITPGDRGRPLRPDTQEAWEELALDKLWMTPEEFEFGYELAHDVLVEGVRQVEQEGVICFDDQVYFSACIAGQFPKYPVIFVDEAQDLSPLNHAMLTQSVRDDGRLVVVGDPKQAIYAFRGADSQSMGKIRGLRPAGSWADRGLLTTFRCPKLIVARQQQHAPGYRAWHTNAEGRVELLRPGAGFALEEGWDWDTIRALAPAPGCRIMVLCRNNGPLLGLAFKLIRNQIGVVMLGRDIGKGLLTLSKKLLPEEATPRDICVGLVEQWMTSECALARANGHEERVAGITDRGECLLAVLDAGCKDAWELRAMLTKLFSRDHGQVELSSIHRAKGLESDMVVHLDPWRIPSKHALAAARDGDRRQLEQEYNLRYVCETRTKHTFVTVNLEDFSG